MGNKMYNDWYYELKLKVISLSFLFKMLKEEVVVMMITNPWVLDDINLSESFNNVKEMIDISDSDLNMFVEIINKLENDSNGFYVAELKDEFEIIKENIHLEAGFITNMINNYMMVVNDYTINGQQIDERLDEYLDNDTACYNQMKINNDYLKKLRKERMDYFE